METEIGAKERKRYTQEQLEVIRSYLYRYYAGSIKARDTKQRMMRLEPSLNLDSELEYWQHAIKVCQWLLRGTGWVPGDELTGSGMADNDTAGIDSGGGAEPSSEQG